MPHCSQVTGTQARDEEKNLESGLSLRAERKLALLLHTGFLNQWEGTSLVFLVLALCQTGKPGSQHTVLGPKTTREIKNLWERQLALPTSCTGGLVIPCGPCLSIGKCFPQFRIQP